MSKTKKEDIPVFTKEGKTAIGGGSLPGQTLPTKLIIIKPPCPVEIFLKNCTHLAHHFWEGKKKNFLSWILAALTPSSDNSVIKIITSVYSKMK